MKLLAGSGAFVASALFVFQQPASAQRILNRGRFKKFKMPSDAGKGSAEIALFDGGPSIKCAMSRGRGGGNPRTCQDGFTSVTVVDVPCRGDGGGITPPIGAPGRHSAPRTSPRMDGEGRRLFPRPDKSHKSWGPPKTCYAASIVDGANGKTYLVNGDGVVTEQDDADYPPEDEPPLDVRERERSLLQNDGGEAVEAAGGGDGRALQSSTPIIDLLVVYTQGAKEDAAANGEGPIEDLVNLAIAETNGAFANSGIDAEIRLLTLHEDTEYTADATSLTPITPALRHLTFEAGSTQDPDGKLDYVHQLREEVGADMVSLVVRGKGCGVAWVSGNCVACRPIPEDMFSVIQYSCLTGHYSLARELGHNMGARHDKGTMDTCGSNDYRHGYRDPEGRFRSIMAKGCATTECDANPGGACTVGAFFSNPDPNYLWNGHPMGASSGDAIGETNNAKRVGEVAQHVADFHHSELTPSFVPSASASPTIRPSGAPTVSHAPTVSEAPSDAPTVMCVNKPGWRYWNNLSQSYKDCDYVGRVPARKVVRCRRIGEDGMMARDVCRLACKPECTPTPRPIAAPTDSPTGAPTVSHAPTESAAPSGAPTVLCENKPGWRYWIARAQVYKGCDYVGRVESRKAARCLQIGEDDMMARDACRLACHPECKPTTAPSAAPTASALPSSAPSLVPTASAAPSRPCADDPDWRTWIHTEWKTCGWVGRDPERTERRCTTRVGEDGVRAAEACPGQCNPACGTTESPTEVPSMAPSIDCTDDNGWSTRIGRRYKNCYWIGQHSSRVENRCAGRKGYDSNRNFVTAMKACPKKCNAACGGCC